SGTIPTASRPGRSLLMTSSSSSPHGDRALDQAKCVEQGDRSPRPDQTTTTTTPKTTATLHEPNCRHHPPPLPDRDRPPSPWGLNDMRCHSRVSRSRPKSIADAPRQAEPPRISCAPAARL